jgi:hypothetical protein
VQEHAAVPSESRAVASGGERGVGSVPSCRVAVAFVAEEVI